MLTTAIAISFGKEESRNRPIRLIHFVYDRYDISLQHNEQLFICHRTAETNNPCIGIVAPDRLKKADIIIAELCRILDSIILPQTNGNYVRLIPGEIPTDRILPHIDLIKYLRHNDLHIAATMHQTNARYSGKMILSIQCPGGGRTITFIRIMLI